MDSMEESRVGLMVVLLDCHPNFVTPEASTKQGKKQAKGNDKIPQAHVAF